MRSVAYAAVVVVACGCLLAAAHAAVLDHEEDTLAPNFVELSETPQAGSGVVGQSSSGSLNPAQSGSQQQAQEESGYKPDEAPPGSLTQGPQGPFVRNQLFPVPIQTASNGRDQIASLGVNKALTDRNGNHLIFLTNQNYLSQNLKDTKASAVAQAAADALASQLVTLAKRKAAEKLRVAEEQRLKAAEKDKIKNAAADEAGAKDAAKNQQKAAQQDALSKALEIKLNAPWDNFGGEYGKVRAFKVGPYCMLQGVARGTGGLVGTLGAACRPYDGRLIFNLMKGTKTARVDILSDGRVYVIAGGGDGWLSFDGIMFATDVDANAQLQNNWVAYGGGYRTTAFTKYKNICALSGLIRSGDWKSPFGTLPDDSGCKPSQRLIFGVNNHQGTTRVDVDPTGYYFYAGGPADHSWVSLDGLAWVSGVGGLNLQLMNNWSNFGDKYRPARYQMIETSCFLSGVIRNDGDWNQVLAQLPQPCRPAKRMIFAVDSHTNAVRVDVFPNGNVQYINGNKNYPWLSLDGIRFVTASGEQ